MDKNIVDEKEKRGGANLRVGLTLASIAFVFFLGVIAKYVLMPS
jgi:hypothetical protein